MRRLLAATALAMVLLGWTLDGASLNSAAVPESPSWQKPNPELYVEGDKVTLTCKGSATGSPATGFLIKKDGHLFTGYTTSHLDNSATITFPAYNGRRHDGIYSCSAYNDDGQSSAAHLLVADFHCAQAPDAGQCPGNVTDTDMNPDCVAPAADGTCPGYVTEQMSYWDGYRRNCDKAFTYKGCGGNLNRFPTRLMCMLACDHNCKVSMEPDVLSNATHKYCMKGFFFNWNDMICRPDQCRER